MSLHSEKIDGYEKYEIESSLDTLISANEILKDKKKVGAVRQLMKTRSVATDEVERQLKLEKKVSKRLKKVL